MRRKMPARGRIIRAGKNAHRFFYFVDGKLNTLQTFKEDVQSAAASLFGFIGQIGIRPGLLKAGFLLSLLYPASAYALPQDGQSVAGNVIFSQNGNTMNITAGAGRSIANYRSFSIGANERVNFSLPGASSAILNRVIGADASRILGSMTSNGRVFLVNPNGVFIGQGANINVGGLFATTLNIRDQDFLNNNLLFYKDSDHAPASVVNEGTINIAPGGFAALVGSAVKNSGAINAPQGSIHLAVGDQVTASISDVALVDLKVTEALKSKVDGFSSAIANTGTLAADGGLIKLQADLVRNMYQQAINQEGIVRAQSVQNKNGVIELLGTSDEQNALVMNAGKLDASGYGDGQTGGTVHVLGDHVSLTGNALVDTSGNAGGGQVRIGGDFQGKGDLYTAQRTFVGENAQIKNDAVTSGDGGRSIVWADDAAFYYGKISAKGGSQSGSGGFVETSGKNALDFRGVVDTSAANGEMGETLLDPFNLTIVEFGGTNVVSDATFANQPATNMTINVGNVNAVGAASNVTLQANNNLTFNNAITPINMPNRNLTGQAGNNIAVNGVINARQVTLQAGNNINVNRNITGTTGVTLTADAALPTVPTPTVSDNVGNITLNANIASTLTNGFIVVNPGAPFTPPNPIQLSAVNITQNSGSIRGDSLLASVHGGGDTNLTSMGNDVQFFSGRVTGADTTNSIISYRDRNDIRINGSSLGNGTLALSTLNGGDISGIYSLGQNFGISANRLIMNLDGGGSVGFPILGGTSDVNYLRVRATGQNTQNSNVLFVDNDGFEIEEANVPNGDIHFITLGGAITQSAPVLANRLSLGAFSGSDITLDNVNNNINSLMVSTDNSPNNPPFPPTNSANTIVQYTDRNSFNVQQANLNEGVLHLTARNGGSITQTNSIKGTALVLNLQGGGDATLNNTASNVASFSANATGANTQNSSVNYTDTDGFSLQGSNMNGGELILTALHGGSIIGNPFTGNILANRLAVRLDGGGDATFIQRRFVGHDVNFLSANATGANTQNTAVTFYDVDGLTLEKSNLNQGSMVVAAFNGGSINQTGNIVANTLNVGVVGGGDATLTDPDNNVSNFNAQTFVNIGFPDIPPAVNTQNTVVNYTDRNSFAVGGASLRDGKLILNALNGGNITQTGAITGHNLQINMSGGGDATLTRTDNNVNLFAGNITGANSQNTLISYTDTNGFTISKSDLLNGRMTLRALNGGNIDQNGAISGIIGSILMTNVDGGGDVILPRTDNNVKAFGASATGNNTQNSDIIFVDANDFAVVPTNVLNGNLNLTTLRGNITQTGPIRANSLTVTVNNAGKATLNRTDNNVNQFAANILGSNTHESTVTYVDSNGFTLGRSVLNNGILRLTAGGNISQTGEILGGNLAITLTQNANVNLTNPENTLKFFAVRGTLGGDVSLFNKTALSLLNTSLGFDRISGNLSVTTPSLLTIPAGHTVFANSHLTLTSGDISLSGKLQLGVPDIELPGRTLNLLLTPYDDNASIGIGGANGSYNLSQAEFNRIFSNYGLYIGDNTHAGPINLGSLDITQNPMGVTFNTRGFINDASLSDATFNIRTNVTTPATSLTFTGGAIKGAQINPVGAQQIGAPGAADIDVVFLNNSRAFVKIKDFSDVGTSFNVATPTGGVFLNVPDSP